MDSDSSRTPEVDGLDSDEAVFDPADEYCEGLAEDFIEACSMNNLERARGLRSMILDEISPDTSITYFYGPALNAAFRQGAADIACWLLENDGGFIQHNTSPWLWAKKRAAWFDTAAAKGHEHMLRLVPGLEEFGETGSLDLQDGDIACIHELPALDRYHARDRAARARWAPLRAAWVSAVLRAPGIDA